MQSEELRERFRKFFEERGHKWVSSSSLLPTDPSVLITTAGMQQFKKYYTGEADPMRDLGSLNTASIQKVFRTSDIEEVGDEVHNTFFEMFGNFSFGGYFKRDAINYAYEFITENLGLRIDYVTVFEGVGDIPPDEESEKIWKEIDSGLKIERRGRDDNLWGPTGNEGPFGPTTEIYVNGTEVWNLVFNQYYQHKPDELGKRKLHFLEELKIKGVDTGMGMERILKAMGNLNDVFETDVLKPIIDKIEELKPGLDKRMLRIFADHLRGSIFLIADGIRPSNKEAGYILRRLLRKIIAYQIKYDIHPDLFVETLPVVVKKFGGIYQNLNNELEILSVWRNERSKYEIALAKGIKTVVMFDKINAPIAFNIYQTFGIGFDLIKEFGGERARDLKKEDFEAEFARHQEVSRAGAEKKFGGHGLILDTGEIKAKNQEELEKVTRLHTATHLLQAALRKILGDEVHQMGSDITAERTRFDFSFTRKMTDEEIKEVEDLVNQIVEKDLPVKFEEMSFEEAIKTGALYSPREKYPAKVKVYYVGESLKSAFSKELCGGPHITQTSQIGQFKIIKEEGTSSGVRRLRADVI